MNSSSSRLNLDQSEDFQKILSVFSDYITEKIDSLIPLPQGIERRVIEAMRYTAINGGKRLRPLIVVECANIFSVPKEKSIWAGIAVELVHSYSLIHDDLPVMDNDITRRGKPTCHVAFDEATALLAGDGLLTLAFKILSDPRTHSDARIRSLLVDSLSSAAGPYGMISGQMLDLLTERVPYSKSEVLRLYKLKTGLLIASACEFGCILGNADSKSSSILRDFGINLGIAFQIADDLLDYTNSADQSNAEISNQNTKIEHSIVSVYGPERSRILAKEFINKAISSLESFGNEARVLRYIASFAIQRSY